jgi:hypothetical protein
MTKIHCVTLARVRPLLYPQPSIVSVMRFHLETSLWHPGAAPVASVSCGVSRTGLGTPIVGFMGDRNHVSALARRAMR